MLVAIDEADRGPGGSWAEVASFLFDHLVGAGEQRGRNFEAQIPGGFEIDDELEFGVKAPGR
jgi:hypothetical protein